MDEESEAGTDGGYRGHGTSLTGDAEAQRTEETSGAAPRFARRQVKRAAEYKLRILKEAEAAKGSGGIGALLRREGLYSSHLVTWRHERQVAVQQALAPKTRGPKPKHDPNAEELHKLRRENQRLTESLRRAEIVIDVQKKVGALLGWPLPVDPEEKS